MYPFIAGGRDSVVLQKAGAIRVGDIVLAHLPSGGYVLHRVYGRSGAAVRLMGDGNLYATESCRAEEVCGSVQEIIRRGKNVRCDGRGERFRVWLWMRLLPVRRYLLAVGKQWKKRGDRK